jgi:adenylate kinase family enzyme
MRRVVVFGPAGSGKSLVAKKLGARTGLRVVELDKLFWSRGWQSVPVDLFRYRIESETRPVPGDPGWIVAGNHDDVRDLTWHPADTLVWLDLPRWLVMWRLFWRTLGRLARQEDLWGTGNRESFFGSFLSRQSTLLHTWKTHRRDRERLAAECDLLRNDKTIVRLRSPREVKRFLDILAPLPR